MLPPLYFTIIASVAIIGLVIVVISIIIAIYEYQIKESDRRAEDTKREWEIEKIKEEASRDAVINKLAASHQLFCPGCGKEMELRPRLIAKEAAKKKKEE